MPKSRLMPNMAALCAALAARLFARRRKKDQNTAGGLWRFAQSGLEQLGASTLVDRLLDALAAEGTQRPTLGGNTVRAFESGDLGLLLEREGDVVETVEQAVAAEIVDGELEIETLLVGDRAGVEIDSELIAALVGFLKQLLDLVLAESNGQDAVFKTVVVENVGESRCDDDAEAVVFDCPNGMLAAGSTAEVAAGQEDRSILRLGLIQLKIRI